MHRGPKDAIAARQRNNHSWQSKLTHVLPDELIESLKRSLQVVVALWGNERGRHRRPEFSKNDCSNCGSGKELSSCQLHRGPPSRSAELVFDWRPNRGI